MGLQPNPLVKSTQGVQGLGAGGRLNSHPTPLTARSAGPQATVVMQTKHVRALCYFPGRPRLIVTFDYLKPGRCGFIGTGPSQIFLQNGFSQLVVETAQNDWFLNPDLPLLRTTLHKFSHSFESVTAIGFSLGGYGVLLLAEALHLRSALLISPQYSIFEHRAPFENRYQKFSALLDPALDDLDRQTNAALRGAVVYDPILAPADRLHAQKIVAAFPGLRPVAMPFGGHPALGLVKNANLFRQIQRLLMADEIEPDILRALHRSARSRSSEYRQMIEIYLQRRRERRSIPAGAEQARYLPANVSPSTSRLGTT
jgi:hypothetical protein